MVRDRRAAVQAALARCYVAMSEADWELRQWQAELDGAPNHGVSDSGSVANKGIATVIDLRPDGALDRMATSQPAKPLAT
jgi:hypothetical protein